MTWKNIKGLKPWLFKSVAVLIGTCYLLTPMRQEITELTHFLSHAFDQGTTPHSMASNSHDFMDNDGRDMLRDGVSSHASASEKHLSSNENGFHNHSHPPNSKPHTHEVIDFMNMAFNTSAPSHQDNEGLKVQTDLDKHLVVIRYSHDQVITTIKKPYFSHIEENTSKGMQSLILPPPKPLC